MPQSDLGLRLLSLAMALALLVVVHGERRVAYTMVVPSEVRLQEGVEPATPIPARLRVAVSGPWARLRNLDASDVGPVAIDVARAGPGTAAWAARPESIQVPAGVRIEALYPSQGTVQLRSDR